ncbi:serine esterase, cutinase family [Mycolicibacterium fortuitum]|uniref:Serine esterase, cutinase family n=1 Tax=Mycolicibacterium fortuitum TaxID=1766 RepID=A0A0N9XPL4_MYCFO|nr:cutinase family protein [Mycolicibacterium fortuitum]ALI28866.1 serine esterase, cutinase family [Mycolicibacterium fortuitum]
MASNFAMPSAIAAPCPDAEVIFARGTMEAPGVGDTGEAFVNSLRANVGAKSVEVYPVDYPATTDFPTAVQGIADARAHIMATAANCPDTKMVLGGFSQGAAVIGFVTASVVPEGVSVADVPAPMPPEVADHVAAVALFGKPSPRFMRVLNNPSVVVGPYYAAKAIDLCVDNDLVCDPQGRSFGVHTEYAGTGLVNQGAAFAASKLQDEWAQDAARQPPPATLVGTGPSQPSRVAPPVQPAQHMGPAPQNLPGPAPAHSPAAPAPVAPAPIAPLA